DRTPGDRGGFRQGRSRSRRGHSGRPRLPNAQRLPCGAAARSWDDRQTGPSRLNSTPNAMSPKPKAALLLLFDIAGDAIAEHDDWHTREHLPERLAIPGFLRGSRWTAAAGTPRYFVMYEVRELATLSSSAYLARLNSPTPWTARMMKSYMGMRRALCSVVASFGAGLGSAAYWSVSRPSRRVAKRCTTGSPG